MAKTPKLSAEEQVQQHLQGLDPAVKAMVLAIRQIILGSDPQIGEQIKWNNPAFYYTGEMAPFDPKEYRRDIAVFNLFKNRVMLVFPTGARVSDSAGILEGNYKDGRRTVQFKDLDDVNTKQAALQSVIRQWLSLIEP